MIRKPEGRSGHRLAAATAAAVALAAVLSAALGPGPAYGDAHAPPPFPTDCPEFQAPPPGYPNPPPTTPWPYTGPTYPNSNIVKGHTYSGPIPYEVPFKAVVAGGEVKMGGTSPTIPSVVIPHLYASLCGVVTLPSLSGTVPANAINLAPPNVYVASLEALPAKVSFSKGLQATMVQVPAPNHGLDITLQGFSTASVSTLGMTCSVTLNALFTTMTSGRLQGQPVTGPSEAGQAESVSNTFPVPPVATSSTCPAPVAQSFNRLLGLPAPAGDATFVAPFCFDFELEGLNNPRQAPVPNKNCPWPSS